MNTADRDPLCAQLDAHTERLDLATLDRLRQARRRAVDEAHRRRVRVAPSWIAATAFAGLAALLVWPGATVKPVPPAPVSIEAFSVLASPEQTEPAPPH